jgi:hypothetical protein
MDFNIKKFLSEHKEDLIHNFLEINSIAKAARKLCIDKNIEYTESFRAAASKIINGETIKVDHDIDNETETNQYQSNSAVSILSALKQDGTIMDIEEYCANYNIPFEQVKTYKLVTHTGKGAYYNIASSDVRNEIEDKEWMEEVKSILSSDLGKYTLYSNPIVKKPGTTGVVKLADLHVGALIEDLIRTKDFNVHILASKLELAAEEVNKRNYSLVHIHILGDILESFTGLSHINSWKSMDKNIIGAKAIKLSVEILHKHFLEKIKNLGEIKIISGNHDRVTSNNKEDVHGDAADLVAWGLELVGYSVEFNPIVITHVVDGIAHILTHGHHGISKKSTKQLCWDYGVQGKYNLICEGHLHSIIQKLSVSQRESFTTIQDDAVDHRRMNCPSFFTGNYFSETLGYTSESGFVITEDNGFGVPNVFYYAV